MRSNFRTTQINYMKGNTGGTKDTCHVLSSGEILRTPFMIIDIAHDVVEMSGTEQFNKKVSFDSAPL